MKVSIHVFGYMILVSLVIGFIACNTKKAEVKKGGFELTGVIHGFSGKLNASADSGEKKIGIVKVKDG